MTDYDARCGLCLNHWFARLEYVGPAPQVGWVRCPRCGTDGNALKMHDADVAAHPPPPGLLLGYSEGWNDAKAGRQYGEGRDGHRRDIRPLSCGVIALCGPNGEPLACGYDAGHEGAHSWATLPTFVQVPPNTGHAV